MQPVEHDRAAAAREADLLDHLGDGADGGVFVLVNGREENLLLAARVDGQRDRHVGEDDVVFQRDEQHLAQAESPIRVTLRV